MICSSSREIHVLTATKEIAITASTAVMTLRARRRADHAFLLDNGDAPYLPDELGLRRWCVDLLGYLSRGYITNSGP